MPESRFCSASPSACPQRVCWHHLRTLVPGDWEATAYSVEDRAGRVEFGTRLGLMACVGWEPCAHEPDRHTTMVAFLRRNVLGEKAGRAFGSDALRTASVGAFLVGWAEEGGPCQALAFCAARKKLVRWIFEPSSRTDASWVASVRPILEAFDFNEGERAEYQLHGLHAVLPREFLIEDMVVLPANVMMSFENVVDKRRATFRRWGLPDVVLAGAGLDAFHASILRTGGCTVQEATACRVNGMEACRSLYEAPREHHMDRFMGRRWPRGEAVVWHDRVERRVYAFEQVGPAKSPALDFSTTLPGWVLDAKA